MNQPFLPAGQDWPKALLFDLDGTLIDSVPDIAAAVNELLGSYGIDSVPVDDVREMVGEGVRKLVERAFGARGVELDTAGLDERHERMMGIYGKHLTARTELMPGARELLERCHAAGMKLALVTNKPEGFSRTILDHFGFSGWFGAVVGGRLDDRLGPKPVISGALVVLILCGLGLVSVDRDTVFFVIDVAPPAAGAGLFSTLPEQVFLVLGGFLGAAAGPLQAASRTLLVHLSPPAGLTQYFGLFALSGKVTSFLAPLSVGLVTAATASQAAGMAVILVFFSAGLMLLSRVDGTRIRP